MSQRTPTCTILTTMIPTYSSRAMNKFEAAVQTAITSVLAHAEPRKDRVAPRPFTEMTESDFKAIGKFSIVKFHDDTLGYTTNIVQRTVRVAENSEETVLQARVVKFGSTTASYQNVSDMNDIVGAVWGVLTGDSSKGANADGLAVRGPDGTPVVRAQLFVDESTGDKILLQQGCRPSGCWRSGSSASSSPTRRTI